MSITRVRVRCRMKAHTIVVSGRGAVRLVDHAAADVRAELAVLALGGEPCKCVAVWAALRTGDAGALKRVGRRDLAAAVEDERVRRLLRYLERAALRFRRAHPLCVKVDPPGRGYAHWRQYHPSEGGKGSIETAGLRVFEHLARLFPRYDWVRRYKAVTSPRSAVLNHLSDGQVRVTYGQGEWTETRFAFLPEQDPTRAVVDGRGVAPLDPTAIAREIARSVCRQVVENAWIRPRAAASSADARTWERVRASLGLDENSPRPRMRYFHDFDLAQSCTMRTDDLTAIEFGWLLRRVAPAIDAALTRLRAYRFAQGKGWPEPEGEDG